MSNQVPCEEERFFDNFAVIVRAMKLCSDRINGLIGDKSPDIYVNMLGLINKRTLIDGFIECSYPYWDAFLAKDEKTIIENAPKIFSFLPIPAEKFKLFEKIYAADHNIITPKMKQDLSKNFQSLVRICIKYIHRERSPAIVDGKNTYQIDKFSRVDLKKHASTWGITLVFN